jgi:hypothetical protein
MEYVVVTYPGDRKVLVDGKVAGRTNVTLMVETGHHIFALEGPQDYQPPTVEKVVENTTSDGPLPIGFH